MKRAGLISIILALALTAATVVVLAQTGPGPAPASQEGARVRFIHASPDAPAVDVLVDGSELFSDIEFGKFTEYTDIDVGIYEVTVRLAGTGTPILTTTVPMTATDYTLAAAGTLDTSGPDFDLMTLSDDNRAPSPGMVRGRFVHLVPGGPTVDIAIKGGPVLFSGVGFRGVGDYKEIAAGTYEMEIRLAGTGIVLGSAPLTVMPNRVYTFFAIGTVLDLQVIQTVDRIHGHTECISGTQDSGAIYLICLPDGWEADDDLLVYAHGYMSPDRPIEIPQEQMVIGGISITETVTALGYGFATTSYSENGLAVLPAISDLLDVVNIFTDTWGIPNRVYLVGVSEGGLITALSLEQYAGVYDGGLAMCGPYGSFQGQINHFGDFRIVFDYFFPGLMPGSPVTITDDVVTAWITGTLVADIEAAVEADENITQVNQLLQVTGVSPFEYVEEISTASIRQLLWYNVFATEDAKEKLGGQPFDNWDRDYTGSLDDQALNDSVERFRADEEALNAMEEYQPTGHLGAPLVTLHTTGDEIVPYWHATEYLSRTAAAGAGHLHAHITVDKHGHCDFEVWDILLAFDRLVTMANKPPTADAGGPYSGTRAETITLDGSGSSDPDGFIAHYAWSINGDQIHQGTTPTHTLDLATYSLGPHTVVLTVTDNDGATDQDATTLTVTNAPPVAYADGPYEGDRTETVTLDGTGSSDPDGTIENYAWQVDGTEVYSGADPTYDLALSSYTLGEHNVVLSVTDNDGASTDDTTTLTVANHAPVAVDDSVATVANTPVAIDVTANDYDPDGEIDPTTVTIVTGPYHGSVEVDSLTGVVTYTPEVDYTGVDTFTYTVDDDDGATSNKATVTINIRHGYRVFLPVAVRQHP